MHIVVVLRGTHKSDFEAGGGDTRDSQRRTKHISPDGAYFEIGINRNRLKWELLQCDFNHYTTIPTSLEQEDNAGAIIGHGANAFL